MSFGEKYIFFFFLVLWKINLSWGASRQHMPKFTNRDINKKRKETLLSTYSSVSNNRAAANNRVQGKSSGDIVSCR